MASIFTSSHFCATRIISILLVFIIQIVFITPALGQDSKIIVRLSGDINYPGDLSVLNESIKLTKVCFLGVEAKGKIDKNFFYNHCKIISCCNDFRKAKQSRLRIQKRSKIYHFINKTKSCFPTIIFR